MVDRTTWRGLRKSTMASYRGARRLLGTSSITQTVPTYIQCANFSGTGHVDSELGRQRHRRAPPLAAPSRSHSSSGVGPRRRRPRFEKLALAVTPNSFGRLEEPYAPGQDDMQDYLRKASLSPWVPLPDAAARRVFDLAPVAADDVHVDLGSGDGRVCFHAIDRGAGRSVGIDVDDGIVAVARDRLARRHPAPPLEFLVADLLDPNAAEAWEEVQRATVLTMHFAKEALRTLRPLLEQKLRGRECTIVTCGYEMPGWEYYQFEVVLGTQLYLYKWGSTEPEYELPFIDSILANAPRELTEGDPRDAEKFQGANVIDRTNVIRGFNPQVLKEMDDLDDEKEDWDDDGDEKKP